MTRLLPRLSPPLPGSRTKAFPTLRARLRGRTRDLHEQVEATVAFGNCLRSREDYARLLCRLLGLHRPLEAALAGISWAGSGLDPAERRKCAWIEADLIDLGVTTREVASVPLCPWLPRLDTPARGLGCLYVLEGSTLGGRIILQQASLGLNVSGSWAGRYFASYGAGVGPMWRDFVAALNRIDPLSTAADQAEQAARETFLAFGHWLSEPRPWNGEAMTECCQ